jgi:ADP-ribose pyrophosphatase YjhB (NUDIX family)
MEMIFEGKFLVASGPVIIEDRKLLVIKDSKDEFYKIPGGTVEEGTENLEDTCHREIKEEINGDIEIIEPLHPMIIWKNPQTEERMAILLIHYLAKLLNKEQIKPLEPIKEIKWIDIEEIKQGKHSISPNIKFLIEKGDIK